MTRIPRHLTENPPPPTLETRQTVSQKGCLDHKNKELILLLLLKPQWILPWYNVEPHYAKSELLNFIKAIVIYTGCQHMKLYAIQFHPCKKNSLLGNQYHQM